MWSFFTSRPLLWKGIFTVADTRLLLAGLEDYQSSLRKHLIQLRTDFEQVENRWHAFSAVYEGDAADQFRANWVRTVDRFREYEQRSDAIARILQERIDFLREANRTDSVLS